MRLVVLFALFAACLHGLPAAAKAPYPFSVSAERNGRNHDLVARNRGPAPVSVRLTLPVSDNVRPTQALPFYAVVGPRSEVVLLTLSPGRPRPRHPFLAADDVPTRQLPRRARPAGDLPPALR